MGALLALVLRNPISSILGVLALVASVALGVQTLRLGSAQTALATLESAIAVEAARSAQEVASKKEADAEKTQALAQQASAIKEAVRGQIAESVSTFAKVASNPACVRTDAANQFDRGLRPPAASR